jgi:hypothetical protein
MMPATPFSKHHLNAQKIAITKFLDDFGSANISKILEMAGFYSKHNSEDSEPLLRVALLELIQERTIEIEVVYNDLGVFEEVEYRTL